MEANLRETGHVLAQEKDKIINIHNISEQGVQGSADKQYPQQNMMTWEQS